MKKDTTINTIWMENIETKDKIKATEVMGDR